MIRACVAVSLALKLECRWARREVAGRRTPACSGTSQMFTFDYVEAASNRKVEARRQDANGQSLPFGLPVLGSCRRRSYFQSLVSRRVDELNRPVIFPAQAECSVASGNHTAVQARPTAISFA